MKVCFILERGTPPRENPVYKALYALLEARGISVERLYPEEDLVRLDQLGARPFADLYLLKSDTELALSLGTALEGMGARVVNRIDACMRAKDKVVAAAVLENAGIAAPRAWVASRPSALAPAFAGGGLILKAHRGYHGAGLAIAERRTALPADSAYPDGVFAQSYLRDAGLDLKVFGIGPQVFGVRKPFAAGSFTQAGEPVALAPEVAQLASRCRAAFGLDLYGIDIAECADGPRVIDVNYFPGYRGVPGAAAHLWQYILETSGTAP